MGAPVSGTANMAFGRLKRGLKGRKIVNLTEMTITVGNGAVLRLASLAR